MLSPWEMSRLVGRDGEKVVFSPTGDFGGGDGLSQWGEMKQYMITSMMGANLVALSLPVAAGTVAYDSPDHAENILIGMRFYF